jgi:hypothetical protein
VFALSHNACTLLRSVIASIIYHSGHISAVIASYSYCSKLILSTLLLLFFIAYLFIYYLSACQLIQFLRFNIKTNIFILKNMSTKTLSDNTKLQFALSHNALAQWRKVYRF